MNHDFISVKEIFDKYKIIYVPYYQRDYVWGSKNDGRNLFKFIDDIFTQYSTDSSKDYFIGTLAFCSEQVNDVIDGQQRLTSLVLILNELSKKCSPGIKSKHSKIIVPEEGKFVIQEEFYLTEELKKNLGLPNNFNSQGYSVDISKTVDRINAQINVAWNGKTTNWYDGLYNYILEKVKLISLEYYTISESLKYFLNINSLSIPLTQSDIFFSILSQAIRISGSAYSIFTIKQKVFELGRMQGISKDAKGYKVYDQAENKGADNVIYVFLNAVYQNDRDIMQLDSAGVGKWISFYKNEVFNDAIKAKEFTENFVQYLKDFETIYKYFANMGVSLDPTSSLYLSWILLQYESYSDVLKVLTEVFKHRHNYIPGAPDLYEAGSKNISVDYLNEIAKRLNLTCLWNYIRSSNERHDGFITNISLNNSGSFKVSISDILTNINYDEIFNLNYNDHKGVSNIAIKDTSRLIKVIMACQEAFLDKTADSSKDFNEYIQYILSGENFSLEHLYSVKEYQDPSRLSNWRTKSRKFFAPDEFDTERFKFENLSLLDKPMNSSAGSDEIKDKLSKYKTARKVCGSNWEYLIQSLADGSEYYKNSNIQSLGLPDRKLVNIDQNTWELSDKNREFNVQLLTLALEEIANK